MPANARDPMGETEELNLFGARLRSARDQEERANVAREQIAEELIRLRHMLAEIGRNLTARG